MAEHDDDREEDEDDELAEIKAVFDLCVEREAENRAEALDDLRFARLGEQWPDGIRKQRDLEHRPCLTINKLPAFIREVVNNARQNKPSIKVHPVDSEGDVETADVYSGLIRAIEVQSKADQAYDTALEYAVTMGFGYIGVDTDYTCDDTFDLDIVIERKPNPFAIYGDPYSDEADSSDWNHAFESELLTRAEFKRRWKGKEPVDWDSYDKLDAAWMEDKRVRVAKYWKREESERAIVGLSNGEIVDREVYEQRKAEFDAEGLTVVAERMVKSHKVTLQMVTGAEILETREWPGRYIPLIPVYGEDLNVEGKRYLRSLVRDAKDPQRMLNYWRTTATELVALAPKAPFIGRKGAFDTDAEKWASANTESHAFIEYDGAEPPQRQPFAGVPAGALQEAINANDEMKSIIGMYDPTLGSDQTDASGKAILLRQKKGDVGSFHFIDNLSRGIAHVGRVVMDLIPPVYSGERILRIVGKEGERLPPVTFGPQASPGQPQTGPDGRPQVDEAGKPVMFGRVYSLDAGKYDLTIDTGPTFATRREEAAAGMIEMVRAYPPAAAILAPDLAKSLDWPGADDIARKFEALQGQQQGDGGAKEAQAAMAKMQMEGQVKQAEMQREGQIAQAQMQQEGQLAQQRMQMEIALKREQSQAELALKREQLQAELQLKMLAPQTNSATSPVRMGGAAG